MSFLRSLFGDLVERRLWPIAAGLMAAIVAVPLLLGGSGGTGSRERAAAAPAAGRAPAEASGPGPGMRVSLDTSTPGGARNRPGSVRNPFRQQHQPKLVTSVTSAATAAAAPTPGGAAIAAITTGAHAGVTPASPIQGAPAATQPVTRAAATRGRIYRVAWRFGEEGTQRSNHDAARLTALPSPKAPLLVFLGLLKDGRTAVFAVRPGVQAHGEGWCRPEPTSCQTLEMRAGDAEFIEYPAGTGGIVQYRFDVVHIQHRTVSAKRALRNHRRFSKAGREILLSAIAAHVPGTTDYVFDRTRGLLAAREPVAGKG